MTKHWRLFAGFLIGAAITPFAASATVASAGGGHGSDVLAKLLFPYSMLLTRLSGDAITQPLIALALVQFPLYGLLVTCYKATRAAICILFPYVAFAALCFAGLLPDFP